MDIQSVPYDDLSSLAWVQDELRKSLDAAHKALRRTLKETEAAAGSDLDDVEPALLRTARGHLHQSVGVLELVGLPAGAALLRGSEAAVQRFIAKPQLMTAAAVEAIERGSFALHDFLARRLAGKPLTPVALFPQYRAVHELAGTPHIHPADLWPAESQTQPLPVEPQAAPRGADAPLTAEFESQVLASMRPGGAAALQRLSDLSAGLAAGAAGTGAGPGAEPLSTLWQLAAGFFQAHSLGLLEGDVYAKRVPSRLLAQLRQQARGETPAPERLARELLFLCAQARPAEPGQAPRLEAVKSAYPAARQGPLDYQAVQLGRYDPAWITQARKRVANAKDSWSAVAGGEMHRLGGLNEQFALVADSLKRLLPGGESLGEALARTVADTVQSAAAPEPAMAMEVATSLLYVEAALEDGAFDQPEQTPRVQHLAGRLDAVRGGAAPQPLETWMEELYRRVSDRQTMGSVVQELRSALSESEKLIDQFFRAPAEPGVLIPVPAQLQAMRGVFSVLGLDKATQAVLSMRDDVDALVAAGPEARHAHPLFERLAGNLSALSFLIDLLGVQPQVVKSLFRFDAETGLLTSRMGRHSTALEVAAASYQVPGAVDAVPKPAAPVPMRTAAPAVPAATGLEGDDEMREVFLEEAREVVGTARGALADLQHEHGAIDLLTTVRRSFHTFKGSARMVGLNEFGEAAWACEQLYNDALARQQPASEDFVRVSGELLSHLAAWIEAIARGEDGGWRSRPVREVADALRLEGRASTIATPAPAGEVPAPAPAGFPADLVLPAASELDLAPAAEGVEEAPAPAGLDFVFDLAEPPADEAEPVPTADSGSLAAEPDPLPEPLQDWPDEAPADADGAAQAAVEPVPPPIEAAEDALPVASVIEPLSPSAEVDALRAAAEDAPAAGEDALDDAQESSTVPFEPNELVVALHPSSPGALAPAGHDEPAADAVAQEAVPSDQLKVIGSLQIGIPLFNIFLTEADELSRRLAIELSEWSHELDRPVGETAVSLAHSLGGSSATVGFIELSALARRLEQALSHSQRLGHGTAEDAALFVAASDEVRRLLHQFAAGFLKQAAPALLERLSAHELEIDERLATQQAAAALAESPPPRSAGDDAATDLVASPGYADTALVPVPHTDYADLGVAEFKPYVAPIDLGEPGMRSASALALDSDEDIDSVDAVDPELFPIFEEEALELLPELASHLRDWSRQPSQTVHASASMRTLHTLKGGARLAGAMRLGEMAHRLETAIEHLLPQDDDAVIDAEGIEQLLGRADGLSNTFEALRRSDAQAYGERTSGFNHLGAPLDAPAEPPVLAPLPALSAVPTVTDEVVPEEALPVTPPASLAADAALTAPLEPPPLPPETAALQPAFDWTRFVAEEAARPPMAPAERAPLQTSAAVRVRTQLLDRMVNQAGEVSIARARLESEVSQIKGSLGDLTDNLERLRGQLRDIELQAETQMATRMEAAKAAAEAFDPLEFDRFTRFQELTRMMAESVNDVATVQRTLQRTLETAEDELAAQARLTRDLQDDLLRTRMVEFEGLSERLYRVVRQTAKETGKQVRLDIVGGSIEVDRGVLDRMTGSFEHLLRNCITHGIEPSAERVAAGKDATGSIVVALHQEGNEVSVEFRDDGTGLDLARIREKGLATGLIAADANPSDAELANLIFMPGFSTADKVTELAGRGVGMDVVRSEVNALGGRIETASAPGQGTSFKLVLPLTTAVTQVVMLRCGDVRVAVPATLIEVVRRASAADVEQGYESGAYVYGDQTLAMLWLGALLQVSGRSAEPTTRTTPVLIVRSAQQRIALHVDEVLGNQEVVVKNLGPQLSSLPGLAGMTLLASGAVTLIYNPVALATVYGEAARRAMALARMGAPAQPSAASPLPPVPLVLVVDDSLTVRRVTQRLLVREGYRVVLAKDGFEALERLKEERPSVVLSDIEMPRMDGFDLLRNIRSEAGLAALPVIMITSRIAQKHRDYAHELGVNHYLGKPYSEEELLSLIGRYGMQQPDVVL